MATLTLTYSGGTVARTISDADMGRVIAAFGATMEQPTEAAIAESIMDRFAHQMTERALEFERAEAAQLAAASVQPITIGG